MTTIRTIGAIIGATIGHFVKWFVMGCGFYAGYRFMEWMLT